MCVESILGDSVFVAFYHEAQSLALVQVRRTITAIYNYASFNSII